VRQRSKIQGAAGSSVLYTGDAPTWERGHTCVLQWLGEPLIGDGVIHFLRLPHVHHLPAFFCRSGSVRYLSGWHLAQPSLSFYGSPGPNAYGPLLWPYRCARSGLFERIPGVYLMQRFGPYIPLLFGIGALLFVVGLLVRIFAPNGLLRDLGSGIGFRYGVGAMLLAIALYAFMWAVEA
jgi:hypothetical protein